MDISDGASPKLVDMFCYLSDTLSVDGDANAAVEARLGKGWNTFRQLVPLLTNKDVSLLMREKLCTSCASICMFCMLHGSDMWPVNKENKLTL